MNHIDPAQDVMEWLWSVQQILIMWGRQEIHRAQLGHGRLILTTPVLDIRALRRMSRRPLHRRPLRASTSEWILLPPWSM